MNHNSRQPTRGVGCADVDLIVMSHDSSIRNFWVWVCAHRAAPRRAATRRAATTRHSRCGLDWIGLDMHAFSAQSAHTRAMATYVR